MSYRLLVAPLLVTGLATLAVGARASAPAEQPTASRAPTAPAAAPVADVAKGTLPAGAGAPTDGLADSLNAADPTTALTPTPAPTQAMAAPSACTNPDAAFDAGCVLDGAVTQLVRQACDLIWLPGVCDTRALPDPGYRAVDDPSPAQPLVWRVGAVHEHSSYSDGDPTAIPRDYFTAGRTGHNLADSGGDTGVILDFMFSSEHSENEKLPITTNMVCLLPMPDLVCAHLTDTDHYWKWEATLRQADEATDRSETGEHTGFTAVRGFEWTNDYFNHMNMYFSTNVVNAKIDGSYLSMQFLWNWLREPVARGGGADALVTFNHPGGWPALTPFDGDLPHNQLLDIVPGGANWNDLAYVPDVDERVAGMEVNGGDDIEWYVKALTRGWHIGPVAAEDEHQREWATSDDGKTLILTRGRSPQDYYFAFQRHRTVAIHAPLVEGQPGTPARVPTIDFYAGGSGPGALGIQDPDASLLGTTLSGGEHTLHVDASGLPAGARVALVSNRGGQQAPLQVGVADAGGSITASHAVVAPDVGEDWYFVVVCLADGPAPCGTDRNYVAVTAPIWLAAT